MANNPIGISVPGDVKIKWGHRGKEGRQTNDIHKKVSVWSSPPAHSWTFESFPMTFNDYYADTNTYDRHQVDRFCALKIILPCHMDHPVTDNLARRRED